MAHTVNQSFCWQRFAALEGNPYVLESRLDGFDCLFACLTHSGDYSSSYFPLAFGLMASLVRMNGGHATIDFWNLDEMDGTALDGRSMVCFFPQVAALNGLGKAVAACRAARPDLPVVLFNSEQHQHEMMLCSPEAERIGYMLMERMPGVDVCLLGEAERAFVALCDHVCNGAPMGAVPFALYRVGDSIRLTDMPQEPVRFEYMPYPARDGLEKTIGPSGVNRTSVRIQSSRGCTSACRFCAESCANLPQTGRKRAWLGKPLELFIDEIEHLATHYGAYYFNVNDSSFEDPGGKGIAKMLEFCREIISRDITASFKIHLRVETLGRLADTDLELLKQAGVDIIVMGVESGLASELESYRKRATAEENINNILRIDSYGKFFPLLGHMMFSPVLRLEDLPVKLEYLQCIGRGWDYLNLSNNLLVFYGTAYHRFLKAEGLEKAGKPVEPIVPYTYRDHRVNTVADTVSALRSEITAVIPMQNMLYDACNILARFTNPSNADLADHSAAFRRFQDLVGDVKTRLQTVYCSYMAEVFRAVESGTAPPAARGIAPEIDALYKELMKGKEMLLHRLDDPPAKSLQP